MAVKKDTSKFIVRNRELCVTLDSEHFPTNVRKAAADVILELVDRLLSQGSDDSKSLCKAVNVSIKYFCQYRRIPSPPFFVCVTGGLQHNG